jgi:hypothetical protein
VGSNKRSNVRDERLLNMRECHGLTSRQPDRNLSVGTCSSVNLTELDECHGRFAN